MSKGTPQRLTMLMAACGLLMLGSASHAQITLFEDFDTFLPTGWTRQNNSVSPQTDWIGFNRTTTVIPGLSQGAAVANYGSTAVKAATGGHISNWLITPNLNLRDGDALSFYTASSDVFPDRLQVRWSATGTDTGSIWSDVGDFSTLLLDINPSLTPTGYPHSWTQVSTFITGIGSNYTSGYLAFRYFVTDGGENGTNSSGVGLDGVLVVSAPEPGSAALALLALPGVLLLRRRKAA
ncbi:MAG: choice-of-anchor J domain-containing protein [Armatimonas sp.]